MSVTAETDGLQGEKAQLKKILQDMEDEEKYLAERLRVVEEKLEIQGLKSKISAKRMVVDQLKSRIGELEGRLREPQREPEPAQVQTASTPQTTENGAREDEPVEVMVKAAPDASQQSETETEKKGRKFFP
jgi:uncharacterized membrane-anchored protein